jgi:hypothetical protein
MQWTQISGVLDRVLIAVGMYAVAKGWISESDMMQFVALLLAIAGAVWGWYVNTNKALVQAAAAVPGTVVVTTPDLARATPNESNIVSHNSGPQAIDAAVADSKVTS